MLHFRWIGWIRFQIPSGSQTVKKYMFLEHFLEKWVPESDQRDATQRNATLRYATQRNATLRNATQRNAKKVSF